MVFGFLFIMGLFFRGFGFSFLVYVFILLFLRYFFIIYSGDNFTILFNYDMIRLYLVILSFLIGVLIVISSFDYIFSGEIFYRFYFCCFILINLLVLVFSVRNFIIFYLVFEFIIIPIFFIII